MPPRSGRKSSELLKVGAKGDAAASGRRILTRGFQRWLLLACVLAPLFAFGIQLIRTPEDAPQVVSAVKSRVIAPLIVGSLASPQATVLEFSLEEINGHLLQILPPSGKRAAGWAFQHASVRLEPERCYFETIYHWKGFNLHLRVGYTVMLQAGKVQIRPFSGSLGRIPLGMFWIKKLEQDPLRKLLPAMKKEQVLMNRLETLRIEPNRILFKVRASSSAASG